MTKDLLVESETVTIVEDPDTIPMSVRHPTKEDKILPREEVEEKNHRQEKQGFGKEGKIIKELHKTKTSSSCW